MNDLATRTEVNGLALCAGVGGLEIGIGIAIPGYRTVGYVERDAYTAATLVARMEDSSLAQAPLWDCIESFDGRPWRGVVDLVSAGIPCQSYSVAGAGRGHEDERALWPELVRIVDECRPALVFIENVPAFAQWFREPGERLCELGYEIEDPVFIAAEDVGASHRRLRVFILAHRLADADRAGLNKQELYILQRRQEQAVHHVAGPGEDLANGASGGLGELREPPGSNGQPDRSDEELGHTESAGLEGRREGLPAVPGGTVGDRRRGGAGANEPVGLAERGNAPNAGFAVPLFAPGPTDVEMWTRLLTETPSLEPSFCGVSDGLANRLDNRIDRLRAIGNGVVPLQAAVALRILLDRAFAGIGKEVKP